MNLRLSLPRFAAVPAVAAAALLLAACGGGSGTAETPAPAAPSSSSIDRQASSSRLLPITVYNKADVAVQVRTFNIDPADWEPGGNPDQFNNVNLGRNKSTRATVDPAANRSIYPFGLQFWKLDNDNNPTELLAEVELQSMQMYGNQCGLKFRGDAESIPCGSSRGIVQNSYFIQISNMGDEYNGNSSITLFQS